MLKIHSYLQGLYAFLTVISKKMYRTCAIISMGMASVMVISLSAKDFAGAGRNKVISVKSPNFTCEEDDYEEADAIAKIQTEFLSSYVEAQSMENLRFNSILLSSIEEFVSAKEKNAVTESADNYISAKMSKRENNNLSHCEILVEEVIVEQTEIQTVASDSQGIDQQAAEAAQTEPAQEETAVVEAVAEEVPATTNVIEFSDEDYEALQRIVEAEATGLDIKSKILVANVIINRVKSDSFPNSVKEVVFQSNGNSVQFSPTADGRYYSVTVTEDTVESVNRALSGEDYSQGALFFSARSKADPDNMSWFDRNLKWLFEYGGHEFYTLKD